MGHLVVIKQIKINSRLLSNTNDNSNDEHELQIDISI